MLCVTIVLQRLECVSVPATREFQKLNGESDVSQSDQSDFGDDGGGNKRANSVDVHIGNRVRLRRLLLGMSQEKLGEQLDVTFQQVQKYERGANRISAGRLLGLSHVLGVRVDYFFDGLVADGVANPGFAEQPQEEAALQLFLNTREGLELNRAFQRITDPTKRRALLDLVKAMAGEGAISG